MPPAAIAAIPTAGAFLTICTVAGILPPGWRGLADMNLLDSLPLAPLLFFLSNERKPVHTFGQPTAQDEEKAPE